MDDLISRQTAVDAIVNKVSGIGLHDNSEVARYGATFRQHEIIDIIESLPSAQPERLTDYEIEVIRIHLSAFKERLCNHHRWEEAEEYQRIINHLKSLSSANGKRESK